MRVRRLLVALLCSVTGSLVTAVLARADASQFTTFEAPPQLLGSSEPVRSSTLDELQGLGVQAIRMTLYWQDVAPRANATRRPSFAATNPLSYDWGAYGTLADEVHARGMRLLIAVTGPVPRWATAHARDHLTDPIPADYKAFTTAVGRRFGGDASVFSIWNEPNLAKFLKPQYARGGRAVSPALYRTLFFAGYDGLRAAGVRAPVLAGETAPVGNPITVAPLRFLRGVLCLNQDYRRDARCSRLPAAGWATHPYMRPAFPTTAPPGPDDLTIGGVGRLVTALNRAASAGMVARDLPVYLTEFGVQSYPNRLAGLPLNLQSDYRSVSEYLAYSNPRVVSFSQYLLTDPPPEPGPAISRYQFQEGLYLYAGHVKKPAYDSFRLPLVGRRHGAQVTFWGLVRPARAAREAGTVSIWYENSGTHTWRVLAHAHFGASGYWTARGLYRSGRHWQVRWTDPAGATFSGAPTAAYSF